MRLSKRLAILTALLIISANGLVAVNAGASSS
jgi:hypothetical protein